MQLAAAVRESDLFRIKTAVAEKGRKMLEKFVEERVPVEVKERMSVAKAEMNRDELEDVLELCDAEGYAVSQITMILNSGRSLLELVSVQLTPSDQVHNQIDTRVPRVT